ncbi:M23 family metallopeptidase [Pseudarthrobacter sp. J75]|uniref:M23 family metallopeptidase n=1 Tax=unclassified Pseudarthrobacter TaxID=2647000 RepID=UPI002E81E20A|nr:MULTISPECIES: M23 family metallopeptidase [unclassified Pseudarthrobacter]MEE2524446.1 M23 family metallopeptidase [Pseudarthrobacter sp. J47]MEE2529877.1 M23 family metallopeptidase [Pseudarthrobacter sp. J75]
MSQVNGAVVLGLPLSGRALVQNSPARRVPSHGTYLMATTYAIDLVPVDTRGHSTAARDWRRVLATEPPGRFVGFGLPVLAPAHGKVVHVHDGEPDHAARRSQLALIPYLLGQAGRLRQGAAALAGNHVVLELEDGRGFVALVHLQRGSIHVRLGDVILAQQPIAACGNSGNSTEPHVHLQVMDRADPMTATGLPMVFERFVEYHRGTARLIESGLPAEGSIVEAAD